MMCVMCIIYCVQVICFAVYCNAVNMRRGLYQARKKLSPAMLPIHCRILLIAPSSLLTVHLRNLAVSSPLEVSSSLSLPPSSRRKKIPYRELWKIPFSHASGASQLTLKQTLDELPSVDSERKK